MSTEIAGVTAKNIKNECGLSDGIPVIYGGGDQPVQAIGNGIISPGMMTPPLVQVDNCS